MSCIVYITNKKTNVKYAYRSESYRDPVTKQPKSRRTYLGRVDPVTNEIIPKAEKGRRNRAPVSKEPSTVCDQQSKSFNLLNIAELKKQVEFLQSQQDELRSKIDNMDVSISKIRSLIANSEI